MSKKTGQIDDYVGNRFSIKKRIGKGAYGIVWKGVDKKTKESVAIKKLGEAFRNEVDARRTFREIMLLRVFRNHPNVVKLNSVHKSANGNDIYLCMEYMDTDLSHVIRRGPSFKDTHKRLVMYQIVNGLRYLHSGNVVHRDLKPNNILVDDQFRCKIGDFGMARTLSASPPAGASEKVVDFMMSDYVGTRWYSAPECIVRCKSYSSSMDMWSLGCILAEMFLGWPIFPGTNTLNQMQRVMAILPEATEEDVMSMRSLGTSVGAKALTQQKYKKTTIDNVLRYAPKDGRDLVKGLLTFNPKKRLTASQVLSHQYVNRLRHSQPEMVMHEFVELPLNDNQQYTVCNYRSKIYDFINDPEKWNQLLIKYTRSKISVCGNSPAIASSSISNNITVRKRSAVLGTVNDPNKVRIRQTVHGQTNNYETATRLRSGSINTTSDSDKTLTPPATYTVIYLPRTSTKVKKSENQENEIRFSGVNQPQNSDNVEPVYRPNAQQSDQETTTPSNIARELRISQRLLELSPDRKAYHDALKKFAERRNYKLKYVFKD